MNPGIAILAACLRDWRGRIGPYTTTQPVFAPNK